MNAFPSHWLLCFFFCSYTLHQLIVWGTDLFASVVIHSVALGIVQQQSHNCAHWVFLMKMKLTWNLRRNAQRCGIHIFRFRLLVCRFNDLRYFSHVMDDVNVSDLSLSKEECTYIHLSREPTCPPKKGGLSLPLKAHGSHNDFVLSPLRINKTSSQLFSLPLPSPSTERSTSRYLNCFSFWFADTKQHACRNERKQGICWVNAWAENSARRQ